MESSQSGTIVLRNSNLFTNTEGEQIVMGRNMELAIIDEFDIERAAHKMTYG
jgi:DNA-directed RNA polymerase subunit beta'